MQASSSSFLRIQSQSVMVLLTLAVLLVAGALLVVYADEALRWYNQPFIGFLPLRNLEVSPNDSLTGADWPAMMVGLRPEDRLDRLDSVDLGGLPGAGENERAAIVTREVVGQLVRERGAAG